ncbi:MAG: C4-dicarboxylate ABC transporter substrate-binding protein, partial [Oscillospiraceae bacterium]|nr:C4-dicarboxylate ABC transporter substrate-binding protein [Oscillospiraceae bacterium]
GVAAADSVAMMAILACTKDLDEEVVYNITKTLFENQDALVAGHARGNDVTLESAFDGVTVEYHPGAVKYFTEKGLM